MVNGKHAYAWQKHGTQGCELVHQRVKTRGLIFGLVEETLEQDLRAKYGN